MGVESTATPIRATEWPCSNSTVTRRAVRVPRGVTTGEVSGWIAAVVLTLNSDAKVSTPRKPMMKLMSFRGVDYMLFDSQLNEQELLVRRTARRFVDERVLPLIRDCYRDGRFPSD